MSITKKTSSAALVSVATGLLVLASVSLLWPPLLTLTLATVAVVSGHTGLTAIGNDPDRLDGRATAITGMVIGYVGLAAGILAIILLNAAFMSFGGR